MNLLQRFRAWRKRRYWQSQQLEHLAVMIRSDWRWLAHDPVARELTDRYVRALRDDWYTLPHEDSGAFRTRIGLDPRRAGREQGKACALSCTPILLELEPMENELKKAIEALAKKSAETTASSGESPSREAMSYSQAALNLAHVLVTLTAAGPTKT